MSKHARAADARYLQQRERERKRKPIGPVGEDRLVDMTFSRSPEDTVAAADMTLCHLCRYHVCAPTCAPVAKPAPAAARTCPCDGGYACREHPRGKAAPAAEPSALEPLWAGISQGTIDRLREKYRVEIAALALDMHKPRCQGCMLDGGVHEYGCTERNAQSRERREIGLLPKGWYRHVGSICAGWIVRSDRRDTHQARVLFTQGGPLGVREGDAGIQGKHFESPYAACLHALGCHVVASPGGWDVYPPGSYSHWCPDDGLRWLVEQFTAERSR